MNRHPNIIQFRFYYKFHYFFLIEKLATLFSKTFTIFTNTGENICNCIFNRSKIKVSYSYMEDMKSIINNHNRKDLNNTAEIKKAVIAETTTSL